MTHKLEVYPPGKIPRTTRPGDFSLHRAAENEEHGRKTSRLGQAIQAGERVRFGDTDYARWTHSTLIVGRRGEIIEADEGGVERNNLSDYEDTDFIVVRTEANRHQRALAVKYAESKLGDSYGILNFIGLIVQCLTGSEFSVQMGNQSICSGLVARATEKYIDTYPRSPECMMPADLAHYWGAISGEKPLPKGFLGKSLDTMMAVIHLFHK